MKIQEFLKQNEMDFAPTEFWAKKHSEIHLPPINKVDAFSGGAPCGKPMLGNNYAGIAYHENRDICPKCLQIFEENKQVDEEFIDHLETQEKIAEKPTVQLSGQDGNVFGLIGLCQRALKKAGQKDNAEKLAKECFASGSYDEALQIMMKYCDVR